MAVNLNGVWRADDGGLYYIRELADRSVAWAGLQDSGFHKGIGFTNVFRGHLSADGKTVSGSWADVPRGQTLGAGTLALDVVQPPPSPANPTATPQLRTRPAGTSGGFGAKVWTKGTPPFGPFPLAPQDIQELESRVQRYDVKLAENNPPCRDFTVMWGTVGKVSAPKLPPSKDDYCSFTGDWDGDGDFDFDLVPDFSRLEPGFWTDGWLKKEFFDGLTPLAANEYMLVLFDQYGRFHCEAPMYARQNDHGHCKDAPVMLLPGWHEQGGNSILVNGRPINGSVSAAPNNTLSFHLGPGGKQVVNLTSGAVARVTGVVADDAGHDPPPPPEIHPVYAVDIVNVQRRAVPLPIPTVNLTGAWHANDIGTYYIRQIGNVVWWLGLSCDQGRSFANVFQGTIANGVIQGTWVDVLMGVNGAHSNGTLRLSGGPLSTELVRLSQSGAFGGSDWTKLYDTELPPPIAQPA